MIIYDISHYIHNKYWLFNHKINQIIGGNIS
nr:MAG TPA: hypothetical protein [Caudoviricetes sp.]